MTCGTSVPTAIALMLCVFFDGGSASLFSLSESHFVLLVEQSLVLSSLGLSFLVKWNDQRASSTS